MTDHDYLRDLLVLTGEDLDRVAKRLFGFVRSEGESDAAFRDRVVTFTYKIPADPADLVTIHVPELSEDEKKFRKLSANLFISPPSALDKDKLQ